MHVLIPKAHRAAFIRFIRLSTHEMTALVQLLKRSRPQTSLARFSEQLAGEATGLSNDDAYAIVKFFAGLYRYRSELDLPAREISETFIEAAKSEAPSLPGLERKDWKALKRTVAAILAAELPLALTAKASELAVEHQRRLCPLNCRVLSDARPVFVGDPTKDPSAVLVQHVLKLAYHEDDGELREFYVTMDSDDVLYLQSILWRAEEKDKSIRRIVKRTGVPVLGAEDEE